MFRKILVITSVALFFTTAICAQGSSTTAATATSGSTATAKKNAPIFRPNKHQIKQVQTILKDKKLYDGEATGTYDDPTRTGIKSFQKDNGLKETGTLNRATLEKFGVTLTDAQKAIPVSAGSFATAATDVKPKTAKTKSSTPTMSTAIAGTSDEKPKRPAPFRATPEQIRAAQKLLKDKSMYTGDETGKLDDPTRDGLTKFQESSGIKVTGTLNALTLEKMGIELTDKQKADAGAVPKN